MADDGSTISVVVPTYRRYDAVAKLLDALANQDLDPDAFEVVVVDDCSADGTAARVAALRDRFAYRIEVASTKANGGPAAARNVGWRLASSPLLAFIDDDCVPEPGWLRAGRAALLADPGVGVVQGHTTAPPGWDYQLHPDWWVWRIVDRPTPWFEGCNIFYRRAALEDGGGFDELIKWWGEDTAAGWGALDAGWARGFAADARAEHVVEQRGWRWHVANGLGESHIIELAVRHPDFRTEAFWRSWAFQRHDAALALAVVSVLAATRRPMLAVGVLPYLQQRRPPLRRRDAPAIMAGRIVTDLTRSFAHLYGSCRHRTLAL